MQKVGLGRVLIRLKTEGLTDEDLNHIKQITAQVREPDGNVVKQPAEFDKSTKEIRFVYVAVKKGTHKVSVKIDFDNGYWITSHTPFEFYASTDFEI